MTSEFNTSSSQLTSKLDISVEELVEAINDPDKAEELMKARGWNKKDLMERADILTKELAQGISSVNMV
jgi:hypothetical protein